MCWTTRCGRDSRRRSMRSVRAARQSPTSTSSTRLSPRRCTCTSCFGEAAAYHARTIETMPASLHAAGPTAARAGALRSCGRLRAGARRSAKRCGARSTQRWQDAMPWCCRRCRFRRRSIGQRLGGDRRRKASGPRPDAAADPALQPHRPSGDFDALRDDIRRPAVRSSTGRRARRHRGTSCALASVVEERLRR